MKRTAIACLGIVLVISMVILAAAASPEKQQDPVSQRAPTHLMAATETVTDPIRIEPRASNHTQKAPGLEVGVAEPHHLPVFDADYDDSWVANVPDEIGGYRVLYIITPKSVACSPEPVILLQAPQESMDEFLSAPPDSNSLSAAIRSIPGAPSHFNLSFGGPIDREAFETRIKERNELAVNRGWCTRFVDPDGPATSE